MAFQCRQLPPSHGWAIEVGAMAVALHVSAPVQRWDSLILSKNAATSSNTKQKPLESDAFNVTALMAFWLHITPHRQIWGHRAPDFQKPGSVPTAPARNRRLDGPNLSTRAGPNCHTETLTSSYHGTSFFEGSWSNGWLWRWMASSSLDQSPSNMFQ